MSWNEISGLFVSSVFTPRDKQILYRASLSQNSPFSENRVGPSKCDPMSKPSGLVPIKTPLHISVLSVQKRERVQKKGSISIRPHSIRQEVVFCRRKTRWIAGMLKVHTASLAAKCKATGQPRLPVHKAGKPLPPRLLSNTGSVCWFPIHSFPTELGLVPGTAAGARGARFSFSCHPPFALWTCSLGCRTVGHNGTTDLVSVLPCFCIWNTYMPRDMGICHAPLPCRSAMGPGRRQAATLVTFVVWQWERNVILAKGSESPLLSAAMRPRAWYMCALSWKICRSVDR